MRTLSVRQVKNRTADAIAQRAKLCGMSMEARVRQILDSTVHQWENEKPQETGREMLERIRVRFDDLNEKEDGVVDEWAATMETSPLRTMHTRNPFADSE